MNDTSRSELPRWQLESIYPGLDSDAYAHDMQSLRETLVESRAYFDGNAIRGGDRGARDTGDDAATLTRALELIERTVQLLGTLRTYLNLRVATDAFDSAAQAEASKLRSVDADFQALTARFKSWLVGVDIKTAAEASHMVHEHLYVLKRNRREAEHLLSDDAEALAAALDASGGAAWAKLYNDLISRERVLAEPLPGASHGENARTPEPTERGIAELRTLQAHENRAVRQRAYDAEIELLSRNQLPFAAAMNGVKGQVATLTRRRGWESPYHYSLFQHGVTLEAIAAMQEACEERFPVMRGYLKSKAELLGLPRLAWYDLFAPLPQAQEQEFTWERAKELVIERFGTFSSRLAAFAARTFDQGWIDVPPRKGKRNGAFCSAIHVRGESRVMLNFGGTLKDVFTLAHELGHAYHNDCKVRFDRTVLQVPTPMTLAETASIFCETIVFEGLSSTGTDVQRLAVLEQNLQQAAQLLLDIHSRFLFESAVFERRGERELSVEELNEAMLVAQAATYGDGLDEQTLHPLMWAHKPHYYSSGLSFYNYPYTFGWLFSLGLYSRYLQEPGEFERRYDELLSATGIQGASELARRFGIDIEDPAFWRSSLDVVAQRVDAFDALITRSDITG